MNDENLIPFNRRTESEQREIARKGGEASGLSRSYFKKFREKLEQHLDEEIDTKQGKMPKVDVMIQNIIKKAAKGDTRAFQLIMDAIKHGEPRFADVMAEDEDNQIRNININVAYNDKSQLEMQQRKDKKELSDGSES